MLLCLLGVSEYLGTEVCTSRQKRFSLVTFVDSPGLVDGDMKYPFDVDEAIMWLGGRLTLAAPVSLIFIVVPKIPCISLGEKQMLSVISLIM